MFKQIAKLSWYLKEPAAVKCKNASVGQKKEKDLQWESSQWTSPVLNISLVHAVVLVHQMFVHVNATVLWRIPHTERTLRSMATRAVHKQGQAPSQTRDEKVQVDFQQKFWNVSGTKTITYMLLKYYCFSIAAFSNIWLAILAHIEVGFVPVCVGKHDYTMLFNLGASSLLLKKQNWTKMQYWDTQQAWALIIFI